MNAIIIDGTRIELTPPEMLCVLDAVNEWSKTPFNLYDKIYDSHKLACRKVKRALYDE
jgi:hypothetical protein